MDLRSFTAAPGTAVSASLIQDFFLARARQLPEAPALHVNGDTWTYGELEQASARFASYLVRTGVGVGAAVGVCMNRSPQLVPVLLGILRAGAAYVPLDPTFPPERLSYMAEDAGLTLLVTETPYLDLISGDVQRLDLHRDWKSIQADQRAHVPSQLATDTLAYIIYTSGSTGRPKGVCVSHANVVNFLRSMARRPGLRASDKLLAITTISFDIHVLEIFLPLSVGARLSLAPQQAAADAFRLAAALEASDVNCMQATPATWRMLINAGWRGRGDFKLLVGGEALPRDLIAPMLERCGQLWNLYGPTETTVWSTCHHIVSPDEPAYIGKPIDNTQVYIVDDNGRLVHGSEAGELYIGGQGVTTGYHKRPELTAEKFIPNPFDDNAGKVYRTGDLVRYGTSGYIEHLGRLDSQVKIRGHRVELGEIEYILAQHPDIDQAIVELVKEENQDSRLTAFCDTRATVLDTESLRLFCRRKLPHYMIPQHFVAVARFPLTPNRKVDRKALVENYQESCRQHKPTGDMPDSELERALLLAWQRVLNNTSITVEDRFVEAGGESILAFDLLLEMRRVTGVKFSYERMLRNPTVKELAASVASEKLTNLYNIIPLQPEGAKPPLYCLYGVNLYQDLADALGAERPVFGIYSPQEVDFLNRVIQGTEATVSVQELAELYSHGIMQQAQQGPVQILGFSFGGVVAVETARLLEEQGWPVSLVVLVDSLLPHSAVRNRRKQLLSRGRRITMAAGSFLRQKEPRQAQAEEKNRSSRLDSGRIEAVRNSLYRTATSAYVKAGHQYDGKVILIKAANNEMLDYCDLKDDYGWSDLLVEPPRVYPVAGSHLDILRGLAVRQTAGVIRQHLC